MPNDEPDAGLTTPVRNRYFFGRLMGVDDLQREQDYATTKRRLANRLLHGVGVVAGLDVTVTDGPGVTVTPGVAIDGWGREIVVTTATTALMPADVLAAAGTVEVVLCYAEEDGDQVPSIGLSEEGRADARTIREVPRVHFRPVTAAPPTIATSPVDPVLGGRADVVRWITRRPDATMVPADPGVVLAHLTVTTDGVVDGVDIDVRAVVVSNAVLLEILLGLVAADP